MVTAAIPQGADPRPVARIKNKRPVKRASLADIVQQSGAESDSGRSKTPSDGDRALDMQKSFRDKFRGRSKKNELSTSTWSDKSYRAGNTSTWSDKSYRAGNVETFQSTVLNSTYVPHDGRSTETYTHDKNAPETMRRKSVGEIYSRYLAF